jgi:hypothetical protein
MNRAVDAKRIKERVLKPLPWPQNLQCREKTGSKRRSRDFRRHPRAGLTAEQVDYASGGW